MILSNILISLYLKRISTDFSKEEVEKITYSMQAILWELEKLIYLLVLFAFHKELPTFIITTIILMSIRVNTDGCHVESGLLCLLLTYLMFYASIVLFPTIVSLHFYHMLVIMPLIIIPTILFAPVAPELINPVHRKKIAIITTLFWYVVFSLNPNRNFTQCGIWIIFIQNIQLIIEYLRRKQVKS